MEIFDTVLDLARNEMLLESAEEWQVSYDWYNNVTGFSIKLEDGSLITLDPFNGDFRIDGAKADVHCRLIEEILAHLTDVCA